MQKKLSKISHGLKKIPEGIVKLKWVFLVLFVALSIFGAVMIPHNDEQADDQEHALHLKRHHV